MSNFISWWEQFKMCYRRDDDVYTTLFILEFGSNWPVASLLKRSGPLKTTRFEPMPINLIFLSLINICLKTQRCWNATLALSRMNDATRTTRLVGFL
jgi:hypothetical protein